MSEKEISRLQKKFKFKEIKVYSSTEWLAENKKKYRQVFNRMDTSYIYVEVSLYNKNFDIEDWEVHIELRCYSVINAKTTNLCMLDYKRKVSRYDHVFYMREGWGSIKQGDFWKKGTYYWEVWIDGERESTKYFYVEDIIDHRQGRENPYFRVESLALYEGPYDDVSVENRDYLRVFDGEETQYIYTEIQLLNRNKEENWELELFIKYYTEARELKGQVMKLQTMHKGTETVNITAGWGSSAKGTWRKGKYTCEIVFLDKPVAIIHVVVGEEDEEGEPLIVYADEGMILPYPATESGADGLAFEDVISELNALIGLEHVKAKMMDHANYIRFLELRKLKGIKESGALNLHSAFVGNPGTGKTTVAKMMGKLYKSMNLLSKGHVYEVDRSDLVGEYIGQTAPKIKAAIEAARGGVLFIDEAYSLARANDDSKDFGREVIEILVKELSNGKGDLAIIVAGYPKEMNYFLNSNPGLKSRFKNQYDFRDYLPQELIQIADYSARMKGVVITVSARERLYDIIVKAYRKRDRTFGNARMVNDLLEKAKMNLGLRIIQMKHPESLDIAKLSTLEPADIEDLNIEVKSKLPDIPIDETLLRISIEELNQLVGITSIKKNVQDLINLIRYQRRKGNDILHRYHFHTLFVGNPGTGKTTVARILATIFKALGVLERGHMVETDRQGLVAGFVGQTAIKTSEKIDESIGGVLYIDEAYSLSHSYSSNDYGGEVIQTLLKRMEDDRGKFFVFAAGYPDNMNQFLNSNPGLSSRFDQILKFDDYNDTELYEIAELMFEQKGLRLSSAAKAELQIVLKNMYKKRDKYFGNARSVRTWVEAVERSHQLRVAQENIDSNTQVITIGDIKKADTDRLNATFGKEGIGFRK